MKYPVEKNFLCDMGMNYGCYCLITINNANNISLDRVRFSTLIILFVLACSVAAMLVVCFRLGCLVAWNLNVYRFDVIIQR